MNKLDMLAFINKLILTSAFLDLCETPSLRLNKYMLHSRKRLKS